MSVLDEPKKVPVPEDRPSQEQLKSDPTQPQFEQIKGALTNFVQAVESADSPDKKIIGTQLQEGLDKRSASRDFGWDKLYGLMENAIKKGANDIVKGTPNDEQLAMKAECYAHLSDSFNRLRGPYLGPYDQLHPTEGETKALSDPEFQKQTTEITSQIMSVIQTETNRAKGIMDSYRERRLNRLRAA